MLFALWLLSVSSETSRPVQIGVYRSIESCKIAATNAVLVGPADSAPKYSFLCVQTRGEINRGPMADAGAALKIADADAALRGGASAAHAENPSCF